MNKIKKVTCFIISVVMATVLTACGNGGEKVSGDKLSIISTIFAPYDFAKAVAGDMAEVTMLLPPASESHSYEPTTGDMIKIQNCDLFIYIGGESEAWVNKIINSNENKEKFFPLITTVNVVEEEIVEGMEANHDHEEDHEHEDEEDHEHEEKEYDEHIWTSPVNAKKMVLAICDELSAIDPENADNYRANADAYLTELDRLDVSFREIVDGAERNVLVFGDRFPFRYFADEYGLEYYAAFPGCSTESEPKIKTIAFLIEKVAEENIPAVLHAEMSNGKVANAIAEQTNAKVLMLHSCHNVSKDEFLSGKTYIELMEKNAEVLKEALNGTDNL